ncbi:class I adenylate-forming enzyme family protein [Xanthobacter autotrophicus]|uniref:class I adenylate-forming enzyme family protein n=1 Tax=Xanthobacter autotrophicus TaxID=280 RepID=UPI003727DB7B
MIDGLTMSNVVKRAAALFPTNTAVIFGEREYSYSEYNQRVNRAANVLKGLGVNFGDHVAILGRNSVEYLEVCHAAGRVGAVFGALNWRLSSSELSFIIADGDFKVLFVEAGFQSVVAEALADLHNISLVVFGGDLTLDGAQDYVALHDAAASSDPCVVVSSSDDAMIMYTSGTTGQPKGAILTHGNICWDAVGYLTYMAPKPYDCALVSMPMFHVSGMHIVTTSMLVRGRPLVIMPQFDPEQACRLIQKHRVTIACILVTPLQLLLDCPGRKQFDLSSLRRVITAAAKYTTKFGVRAKAELGLERLHMAYGLTEAAPLVSITEESGQMLAKENTLGRPVWYLDVRIVDDNGQEVAVGEQGEILVRGPNVFKGYYKRDEMNAEVRQNGWLHTGDIGYLDSEGYLFFVDRKKDIIKSGGENVSSLEVEIAILRANPELAEAAVVGIAHERWGEAVNAFVVIKSGQSCETDQLISRTREYLAGYKLPKSVHFRDNLPKNGSGKVLKRQLRESVAQNEK